MDRRIVISGLGVVSSVGTGTSDFWDALIKGKSGISKVSSFDTSGLFTHYGAEIKDFNPEAFLGKEKSARLGRASSFALVAAGLALEDAGFFSKKPPPEKFGVCCGTTMGESQILERINNSWLKQGIDYIETDLIPRYPSNVLSNNLAREFNLNGPNLVIPNACAAGNFCIGYAYDLLKLGQAQMMIAGGTDAFSRIAFVGFNRMFAIAPEKCQPFDKNRKGMMVGEGAGMVVLEFLDSALERKANIYAEVLGYGVSSDAYHMTAPLAEGIKEAIEKALTETKITPGQVDYFNAHGTGTRGNDLQECLAIKKVFKEDYKRLAVSSIKSMIGHAMGAASAIETVACCLALKNGIIPPTINYETPDPECDIDCVPNQARPKRINIALNNACAFGGNNACLVLKKYPAQKR